MTQENLEQSGFQHPTSIGYWLLVNRAFVTCYLFADIVTEILQEHQGLPLKSTKLAAAYISFRDPMKQQEQLMLFIVHLLVL